MQHLLILGSLLALCCAHALPGGKAALYDIAADPGETTDAQTKFPEVTARMAKECRARWQVIIASGRAFTPESSLTK